MNTEQTSKNIFTYVKTHYGETIPATIWKLKKTMIKYSSYTKQLRFSLRCHHNKIILLFVDFTEPLAFFCASKNNQKK